MNASRRSLLGEVTAGLERHLTPPLGDAGFSLKRRDHTYVRDQAGVVQSLALAITSRPPSLGRRGILIEPVLRVKVSAWTDEAERRLRQASALATPEHPGGVVWELLDWLTPGKVPHWSLSDIPTDPEIDRIATDLARVVEAVAVPRFEISRSPDLILSAIESGQIRPLDSDRFTVACGAILEGRRDLAADIIEPIGRTRREGLARVLGF